VPFEVPTPLREQDGTSTSARCRGLAVYAAGLSSWRLFCMIALRHSERPHLLAPQRYSRVELGNRSADTKAYARGDEPMPQAIAARIVEKGGDHVLALKGNHRACTRTSGFSSTIRSWRGPARRSRRTSTRRSWPYRRAPVPGRGRRLARRVKPRDEVLRCLDRAGSKRDPPRRTIPLGHQE
jgi:hypothetical protein